MSGYHRVNRSRSVPSRVLVRVCRSRWAPTFDHCICCFLAKRRLTTRLTVDSTKAVEIQGNRIWSLRLLKAGGASWGSGVINSDQGCRNGEEPASVRSFARSKGSSPSNHLPNFSYAIALVKGYRSIRIADMLMKWGYSGPQ